MLKPKVQAAPATARFAVATMFFINGVAGANWVARIPAIQQRAGLDAGGLGLALLGGGTGALLLMPLTGGLVARFGSRLVTTLAAVAYFLVLALPAFATNLPTLFFALMLGGASTGAMDVAMNSNAVAVEGVYGCPIMSSFHALYSLGAISGAVLGGLVANSGLDPAIHLLAVGLVLVLIALAAGRLMLGEDLAKAGGPVFALPGRAVLGLGAVAFCCLLAEGAVADWSAVYLQGTLATSAGLAAVGYAAFSLTMTLGRLVGDWVNSSLGPVAVVRGGGLLAAVGLGLGLLAGNPYAAILGFACVGAGLATIFPTLLSAAGRSGPVAGPAVAAVSTCGYFGLLAGPPLIGFVGRGFGLSIGLGLVVVSSLLIAGLAGAAGRASGAARVALPLLQAASPPSRYRSPTTIEGRDCQLEGSWLAHLSARMAPCGQTNQPRPFEELA